MDEKVGTAPGTLTVVMPDGEVIELVDWIEQHLYGMIEFSAGDTTAVEAFSQARSQPIPGGARNLTSADTNTPRAGNVGLPQSWEFLTYGIGVYIKRVMRDTTTIGGGNANDGLSDPCGQRTYFQFSRLVNIVYMYNGHPYAEGTLEDYPQGGGIHLYTTLANRENASNGIPSPRDRVATLIPVRMRENLGFSVIYTPVAALICNQASADGNATAMQHMDVQTKFFGLLRRNVGPT